MADLAHQGRIGCACQLVVLKPNDEIFFWFSFCLHMFKEFRKSALPTLFHFVRVRAAFRPYVWKFLIKYTRHYNRIYFYFLIPRTSTDFFKSSRDFCHYGLMLLIFVTYKVQNLVIWGNFLKMWPLKEGKNELTNWKAEK